MRSLNGPASMTLPAEPFSFHAEQGFGDTLQFCRYAPRVAARGARVILEVQKPLVELMRTLSGDIEIVKGRPPARF